MFSYQRATFAEVFANNSKVKDTLCLFSSCRNVFPQTNSKISLKAQSQLALRIVKLTLRRRNYEIRQILLSNGITENKHRKHQSDFINMGVLTVDVRHVQTDNETIRKGSIQVIN